MTIRALSVFGTRPEAIKMAPLVRRLACDARFQARVCVTAQHREMLDSALALFEIRPDHDLNVMAPGQDLFDVTAKVLVGLRRVLREERPDVVLVHGDTTSCLAASLAAFYERIPLAHVEAGLRSGDLAAPFPEELNRIVADSVARWHFAPTSGARDNLLAAGADPSCVYVVGNTVIDALKWVRERICGRSAFDYPESFGPALAAQIEECPGRVVLVTGHRRENFGAPFEELCRAIRDSAAAHPDWLFVYPTHLNPNVQRPVRSILAGALNVALCAPLDYAPFVWLMNRCDVILTDSGGVQEEGSALGKPVLVMREVTERPEVIAAGAARLVGACRERIVTSLEELLGDGDAWRAMANAENPYGDGTASEQIAQLLATHVPTRSAELAVSA